MPNAFKIGKVTLVGSMPILNASSPELDHCLWHTFFRKEFSPFSADLRIAGQLFAKERALNTGN